MIIWLFILKKKYLKVLIMKRFYNGLNIWNLAGSNYELYKKKEFYEAFFYNICKLFNEAHDFWIF
jgi:hypothetical protein